MNPMFRAVAMWLVRLGWVTAEENERPSVLQGRVLGDGHPLTGALVSDGHRVVQSDDSGHESSAESRTVRRGEFYGLDEPLAAGTETPFVFNCYDAPKEAVAAARLDTGPWQPMPAFAAPSPATAGLTMPHHYRLISDTSRLEPGRHTITARVTFPDGSVVEEHAAFQIAPSRDQSPNDSP